MPTPSRIIMLPLQAQCAEEGQTRWVLISEVDADRGLARWTHRAVGFPSWQRARSSTREQGALGQVAGPCCAPEKVAGRECDTYRGCWGW
jgi:hypothetical protein